MRPGFDSRQVHFLTHTHWLPIFLSFLLCYRPVRLYTFLRRPSVFSMCKMLMRPPTTMRPVPFRLLFLSQDAVLNTRCFLLMTILISTLYTTQHSCADSSFPLQYRAEQCTFPQIDAQTRHFDAFLRCHDFSFRLTLATLSCWCTHDVHVSTFWWLTTSKCRHLHFFPFMTTWHWWRLLLMRCWRRLCPR